MWPFSALTLTDPKAVGQPQATLSRLYTANAATKLDTRCVIQAAKVLELLQDSVLPAAFDPRASVQKIHLHWETECGHEKRRMGTIYGQQE